MLFSAALVSCPGALAVLWGSGICAGGEGAVIKLLFAGSSPGRVCAPLLLPALAQHPLAQDPSSLPGS